MLKMKNRLLSLLFSTLILFTSFSSTAIAIESTNVNAETELTEEIIASFDTVITPKMMSEGTIGIMPCADVDQSFTMSDIHRGGDRRYSGEYLRYSVTITDIYGNAVDNVVNVQLFDYNHSYALKETNVTANGITVTKNGIDIVPNRTYYFMYVPYGVMRTLRVHMTITSYS